MDIGIVGGGINGLCCAWHLARQGHQVSVYERDKLMHGTSCSSSKLLHGGLRYLENGEFRLVKEALREREAWLKRAPDLTQPLRMVMPIYKHSRRGRLMVGSGLFLYDRLLATNSTLPGMKWLNTKQLLENDPSLNSTDLLGGYEFSDGQMDDYALGLWVSKQAQSSGAELFEKMEVKQVTQNGGVITAGGKTHHHDRVLNIAGPWAARLLERSGVDIPYKLDLVRGSHLILDRPCPRAYLLEIPGERRIFFVLPWKGQTLVGTTEIRQSLEEPIECSEAEVDYLMAAFQHYWPTQVQTIAGTFAGLRPLLFSAKDPTKATREYAIHRTDKLVTVLGGKWTTAMALATKVSGIIQ